MLIQIAPATAYTPLHTAAVETLNGAKVTERAMPGAE